MWFSLDRRPNIAYNKDRSEPSRHPAGAGAPDHIKYERKQGGSMYQVIKRDGKVTEFQLSKIGVAITKAF